MKVSIGATAPGMRIGDSSGACVNSAGEIGGTGRWVGRAGAVLVTGASGFVGKALVPALASAGYRVITAGRNAGPDAGPVSDHRILPDPITASREDFDALVAGTDHVVHLAAIAHTRLSGTEATKAYLAANYLLPKRIAAAVHRGLSGKLVFLSSVRAQAGPGSQIMLTEHEPARPKDDYGRAKLAAEQAIGRIMTRGNFSILRPAMVYGPHAKGNFGLLTRLAAMPVPLPFASLTARRSLVAIDALCDAIVHCLAERRTDGEVFLVCDGEPIAVCDIVAEIRRGMGRDPMLFAVSPAIMGLGARLAGQSVRWRAMSENLVADCSHLCRTGWHPVEQSGPAIRHYVATGRVRP